MLNLILQLIKGISNDLKKLLKYFNGTTNFTFLLAVLLATTGSPNNSTLYLQLLDHLLVVHLVYIDKKLLMNLGNYLNVLLNYT